MHEPATAATIAERAHCSPNAARKHLGEFVDLGLVREHEGSTGTTYVRNEAYFRWRQANELAQTYTIETLLDELATLESRDEEFQKQFDATTPAAVDIPDEITHAELEKRLETLSEWATVREAIDRQKEAIRIARRGDGRLTA